MIFFFGSFNNAHVSASADLKRTIPQMNNFVVYDGFFEPTAAANAEEIARAEERHVNITNR